MMIAEERDFDQLLDLDMEEEGNNFEDIIKELYRCWRNERGSPELQSNPEDLIKEVLELIEFQSNKLSDQQQQSLSSNHAFLECLYQMDLERIKFVVKSLLRCRLSKIERGWAEFWPTWSTPDRSQFLQSKMTGFEREYLESFASNIVSCLGESVIQRMPEKTGDLDTSEMLWQGSRPVASNNPNAHVICRVKKDLGEVILDPITRATAELQANDTFVLQYAVIKSFLDSGEIELI